MVSGNTNNGEPRVPDPSLDGEPPVEAVRDPGPAASVAGEAAITSTVATGVAETEAASAAKEEVMERLHAWARTDSSLAAINAQISSLKGGLANQQFAPLTEQAEAKARADMARLTETRDAAIARDMAWSERLYDAAPTRVNLGDSESMARFREANGLFVRIGRSVHAAREGELLVDAVAEALNNPDNMPGDGSTLGAALGQAFLYDQQGEAALKAFLGKVRDAPYQADAAAGRATWTAALAELRPHLARTTAGLAELADRFLVRYADGEVITASNVVEGER